MGERVHRGLRGHRRARGQSPAELDRRIAYLDERLAELDALLQVLDEADHRVAERAAQAASELRGPGTCAAELLS